MYRFSGLHTRGYTASLVVTHTVLYTEIVLQIGEQEPVVAAIERRGEP
jgi:hypothetical protein